MRKIYFIVLVLVLFVSCKKDNQEIINTKEIGLGDYSGMIVSYYDTLIAGGYHDKRTFKMDLNNDSIDDILFISDNIGSLRFGAILTSEIACLHSNVALLGYEKNDTTFLNLVTSVVDTTANNELVVNKQYKYSCLKTSSEDSISEIKRNIFWLIPKVKDENLFSSELFKTDSVELFADFVTYTEGARVGADTIICSEYTYFESCENFPQDEIRYVGFKIKTNEIEKLGWIKLLLFDDNKILILESAIQN
jgi:hypothetical protein